MDNSKGFEWFMKNLHDVIDSYEAKFNDLESEIKELKCENRCLKSFNENLDVKIKYLQPDCRNLKSYIEFLENQNKALIAKNENLESDVRFYKELIV